MEKVIEAMSRFGDKEIQIVVELSQSLLEDYATPSFRYSVVARDVYSRDIVADFGGVYPIDPVALRGAETALEALGVFRGEVTFALLDLLHVEYGDSQTGRLHEAVPTSRQGWALVGATSYIEGGPLLPFVYNVHSGQYKVLDGPDWEGVALDLLGHVLTNTGRIFAKGHPGGVEPAPNDPCFYFRMYYPQAALFEAFSNTLEPLGYKLPRISPLSYD